MLQPVVAPEQLTVAGSEARCTEHAEPLCCFDLRPQARLDVIRLGRFERQGASDVDIPGATGFQRAYSGLVDPAVPRQTAHR